MKGSVGGPSQLLKLTKKERKDANERRRIEGYQKRTQAIARANRTKQDEERLKETNARAILVKRT